MAAPCGSWITAKRPTSGISRGLQHDFPAELLCLFCARIDIVNCHIAEPGRGHSLLVRWYQHYTALAHVGSALPHNRVGEVGHWKILSSPPEQLRIKLSRRARVSGQEFIPAKLAVFGLCGVHIWVLLFISAFVLFWERRKLISQHKILFQLIQGATSAVAVITP